MHYFVYCFLQQISIQNPPITAFAFNLRAAQALNADLTTLDKEFNKLSEVLAAGERDNHNAQQLVSSINMKQIVNIFQSCQKSGFDCVEIL